ncbi:CitMHS family transporter [Kordiimonas aestuarii]|uniref:CitMHS family transporter n=1 Tax=Kordiimonas aestuarii TaxID=1005925 RepID=UPI0021D23B7A|nr:citrate:proton symporter [Kordiimonas aestuarii]
MELEGNNTVLALLGFAMIATFMVLIMTRRLSAAVALIIIPIVFGLLSGHSIDMGMMIIKGLMNLAPTATALVFAVLYFAIMMDAGLFDPLVERATRFAKGDPRRVAIATAIVATLVSFDGDGATTAIVTITAFLPIYRKLGMNPLILAVLMGSANSAVNLTPWGGPTLRAATALQVDMMDVFLPLIPVMIAGLAANFGIAWYLGTKERNRLGIVEMETDVSHLALDREEGVERPKLFWFNLILTVTLILSVVVQFLPLPIAFMIGLAIAVTVNYPVLSEQRDRIAAHAHNVLPIALLIFAAAVFTGIIDGTGMVAAMGSSLLAIIPDAVGPYFGVVISILSAPLTFIMSNDAYYFGIVPVLAETAGHYGIEAVEVARASLLGVAIHALSPLIAAIYLVAGLLDVEVGELQRFALPFALIVFAIMVLTALLTGAVPITA